MLASGKDVFFLCGYVVTAFVPPRLDGWITAMLGSLYLRCKRGGVKRAAEEIQRTLGPLANGHDPARVAELRYRMLVEERWSQMRAMHPDAWKPHITLEGMEHVENALARGKGAILWGMSVGSALAVKQGLWRGGIRLVHLSSVRHAVVSDSALAWKVVAPLRWRSEDPYLLERIIIPLDGSVGYLRTLSERLEANSCVSIRGENQGRQNVETPFFHSRASFAVGAPSLAYRVGSALLPVYALRIGPHRHRVVIEHPIEPDRGQDRKAFAEAAVQEFSKRLQRQIVEHPADWDGWTEARL